MLGPRRSWLRLLHLPQRAGSRTSRRGPRAGWSALRLPPLWRAALPRGRPGRLRCSAPAGGPALPGASLVKGQRQHWGKTVAARAASKRQGTRALQRSSLCRGGTRRRCVRSGRDENGAPVWSLTARSLPARAAGVSALWVGVALEPSGVGEADAVASNQHTNVSGAPPPADRACPVPLGLVDPGGRPVHGRQ